MMPWEIFFFCRIILKAFFIGTPTPELNNRPGSNGIFAISFLAEKRPGIDPRCCEIIIFT